ncbi:hypothetical protein M6B38_352010 [Iris pallida]|uniref:Uncharacterized protein n=1 Tax=Iris pallida TaxID=29817 RepID=A0AAX6GPP6_IRIPA|nr:hypothetical protein M6B38_352010 [Iris pallida]
MGKVWERREGEVGEWKKRSRERAREGDWRGEERGAEDLIGARDEDRRPVVGRWWRSWTLAEGNGALWAPRRSRRFEICSLIGTEALVERRRSTAIVPRGRCKSRDWGSRVVTADGDPISPRKVVQAVLKSSDLVKGHYALAALT